MKFEKEGKFLSREEFENLTGAVWSEELAFRCSSLVFPEPDVESKWLGACFSKDIGTNPRLVIRWINPHLGWGVFSDEILPPMSYVGHYAGVVRRRSRMDWKNSYCFEYVRKKLSIDARDQGGVGRFLNHSDQPNLISAMANLHGVNLVIFYTKHFIAKGEQLCYNYGPDYWKQRESPISI